MSGIRLGFDTANGAESFRYFLVDVGVSGATPPVKLADKVAVDAGSAGARATKDIQFNMGLLSHLAPGASIGLAINVWVDGVLSGPFVGGGNPHWLDAAFAFTMPLPVPSEPLNPHVTVVQI